MGPVIVKSKGAAPVGAGVGAKIRLKDRPSQVAPEALMVAVGCADAFTDRIRSIAKERKSFIAEKQKLLSG